MPARFEFTLLQEQRMRDTSLSQALLAAEFGCSTMPIRNWRRLHGITSKASAGAKPVSGPLGTAGVVTDPDGSKTITSPPIQGLADVTDAEAYLRARWNLPADKWGVRPVLVNEWEANAGGGEIMRLGQVKGTFYPLVALSAILPAPAKWTGPKYHHVSRNLYRNGATHQILVVGDDQAPYNDERLTAATVMAIQCIQPAEIAHVGDLCDYTNISKHKDHAVVKAAVDDCTNAGVAILAGMRAAAPSARFRILAGNHDVRPLTELLLRAERMADIHVGMLPGETERRRVLDMRELWRLNDLGIEYVEDPRGWEHAELDLVPGPRGLAAVHGTLTGKDVARRTMEKIGRSVIMGHTHGPEEHSVWNKTIGFEMRSYVLGCQCEVRGGGGKSFPTFAPRDGWLQGGGLVTVYADGEWVFERMRWNGESLFADGHRFTP